MTSPQESQDSPKKSRDTNQVPRAAKVRCKAKSRNTGEQCKNLAVEGMEVCRFHGGKSLRGPASPAFKHGRYSKYMPKRLEESFQASLVDPERLALVREIALVDARTEDLLSRVDSGESGELWRRATKALEEYVDQGSRNTEAGKAKAVAALAELKDLLAKGVEDAAAWSELTDLVDTRRKLVDSESRRQVQMGVLVGIEQLLGMREAIFDVITRHVTDPQALSSIGRELSLIANAGQSGPGAAGS